MRCFFFFLSDVRFLFILLGPVGRDPQYHEIGRSIATLMTDEVGQAGGMRTACLREFTVEQKSTSSQSDGTFLSMTRSSELL